jgi:ABC-type glycerol-3-phosphate transport system permease component
MQRKATPTAKFKIPRGVETALLYVLLLAVSLFMILPFIWMISTSLKPNEEVFGLPPRLLTPNSSLNNYRYLFTETDLPRILLNTTVIATGATLLQLLFSALAGYGFAKFTFPGRGALFAFILATMILPFTIVMVPLYVIMRDLDWLDTFWPLIIPGAANAFGIFFMRQYTSTISDEILDAARIDGAGEARIFWRVILPIVAPGLSSLGLIFFMNSWNNYLWPLIILQSPKNHTLPLLIRSMVGVGRSAYELQMAASVISIIPLLILFLVFQRRFVEGITAGAVRG